MGKHITKVSFKAAGEKGVKIAYETFDESGPLGTTTKVENKAPHISFDNALQGLKPHLCIIAEEINTTHAKKFSHVKLTDKEQEKFRVCGVTISHQGTEKESIILTGYKTLETGLGFVFNTPGVRVESESETAYPFIAELLEAVELVKTEADSYLHGKYRVIQGELELAPKEKQEVE